MEFKEMKRNPEFNLKLTLGEAISLWHVVNGAYQTGINAAEPFVDALYDFAKDSNSYTTYLEED